MTSVKFHGDLILSKCAREGKIVLWRIKGFSSTATAPSPEDAPIARLHEATRSAFGDGYERLLQFQLPNTDVYYVRFALFSQPFKHAVLAAGNNVSTVFLWDLQQLLDWEPNTTLPFPVHNPATVSAPVPAAKGHGASSSKRSGKAAAAAAAASVSGHSGSSDKPGETHDVSSPFALVHAHSQKVIVRPKDVRKRFSVRQVAWSVGGEWMVAVGDNGAMAIFGRWETEDEYIRNGKRA